jgi:RNA polymerase sigma factor (sigma-70 family)
MSTAQGLAVGDVEGTLGDVEGTLGDVEGTLGDVEGRLGDVGELYRSLSKRLEQIVRVGVQAPDAVIEDACQFAWTRLVHHRGRVHRDTALGWLAKTAVHEAFKLTRRGRRELSFDGAVEQGVELAPPATTPSLQDLFEQRARLAAVGFLPRRQQRLLWLRALGFSYEEIASRERCTPRTVERQLLHARRALRTTVAGV